MNRHAVSRLALQTAILLALIAPSGFAAPPTAGRPPEEVAAPLPDEALPSRWRQGQMDSRRVFPSPVVSENPNPPAIAAAQPTATDQALPVNLATALCLSNARPLVIAFAQASVEEAAARLQNANVLWLPNFNVGTDYYRHDGIDQDTSGTIIRDDKYAFAAGGGATLSLGVTDAIFRPLAARQELAARESDLQTARNDALFAVAAAYFDVQLARGRLAGALDSAAKAESLVRKVSGLAEGLVAPIEADRAQALLFDLRQQVAAARGSWRVSSARLARVLRLNPAAVVVPLEPPHLQVTLISPAIRADELIPVALSSRPELASRRALVQASLDRVRQERLRPWIPNVVMQGRNGPGGAFQDSLFGGGPNGSPSLYGNRFDMDLGVVWTLNNLGAGNRSLVRAETAVEHKASIDFLSVQDLVAEEVVQARADVEATAAQIDDAAAAVKEATITYIGTLRGLGETRGSGGLLVLVSRPQEAVAALQQLSRSYDGYYAAINGYNRGQFQLYRALGCPARTLICDCPLGEVGPLDTSRPPAMAPPCPHVLSQPCR